MCQFGPYLCMFVLFCPSLARICAHLVFILSQTRSIRARTTRVASICHPHVPFTRICVSFTPFSQRTRECATHLRVFHTLGVYHSRSVRAPCVRVRCENGTMRPKNEASLCSSRSVRAHNVRVCCEDAAQVSSYSQRTRV